MRRDTFITLGAGLAFVALLVGSLYGTQAPSLVSRPAAGALPAAPVVALPARATVPAAPVVLAPPPLPVQAAPVMIQPAALPEVAHPVPFSVPPPEEPAAPLLMEQGPFHEEASPQEMPEIQVTDDTGIEPAPQVEFHGATGDYRLTVRPGLSTLRLPAGNYRYEFRGGLYRETGQPDQVGTFTCRRFRLYTVPVHVYHERQTRVRDLGD